MGTPSPHRRRQRGSQAAAWLLALAAALSAAGCTDPWRTAPFVDGLRVLAIRAEPPDLAPGQATVLDAVVVDPRDPSRLNTLVWLVCDPDPSSLDQPACAQTDTLQAIEGGGDGESALDPSNLPPGLRPLGMTAPPGVVPLPIVYTAPADVFAQVAPSDPRRIRGVLAVVLLLAVAEPPSSSWPPTQADLTSLLERVRSKQVDSVLSIKRLRISENPTPNHNPTLAAVKIAGESWGPGPQLAKVLPGTWTNLAALPEGAAETYQDLDADGNLVTKQEILSVSWFTTVGELGFARTLAGELDHPEQLYTPFVMQKVPDDRRGVLYAVLRDGRGGASSLARGFFLCDPNRASPTLTSIEPSSGPRGTLVALRGERLDDLLDARAGAGWLSAAAWSDSEQAYVGAIPADAPAGEMEITPRGKGCGADPVGSFTVIAGP